MASRRDLNTTDESIWSVDSNTRRDVQAAFSYLKASELEDLDDTSVLQRSLTLRSVVSTTSSYAKQSQKARGGPFRVNLIGEGLQGAIFEQLGYSLAMKKEKPGNERKKIQFATRRFGALVQCSVIVPNLDKFMLKANNQEVQLQAFPQGHRQPGNMITMQRILPLTKVMRKSLIKKFYPHSNGNLTSAKIRDLLNEPANKHALIRTYFGRKAGPAFTQENFALRNFPLYLEAMQRINLDQTPLIRSMGKAFAIMHWGAGVNGDDVEFVLGTSLITPHQSDATNDFQHRRVGFFLLDFGQCDRVDLDREETHVVYQAFKGAMVTGGNQLFIPNCMRTPDLFAGFKQAYIETGKRILTERGLEDKFDMEEFMKDYEEYVDDLGV